MPGEEKRSIHDWGAHLKEEWNERARSKSCRFFVASHAEWNDDQAWSRQAAADAEFCLSQLDPSRIPHMDILEVGCGIGRLAPPLSARSRSYTGFDVSPVMVAQARKDCRELSNTRFFESDGITVPPGALDQDYQLILAVAVFIHCPLPVIRELLDSVLRARAPDGVVRLHLRADVNDQTGFVPSEDATAVHESAHAACVTVPEPELVCERYYAGHAFQYEEARSLLEDLHEGAVRLHRLDLLSIYAELLPS